MKKAFGILGVLLLGAALLALPAPAKAEMYVEAYLGGGGASNIGDNLSVTSPLFPGFSASGQTPGNVNAFVIGGLKVGTWFVPTGFLGFNYPDWMKYFGFYTDFSFQRLDTHRAQFTGTVSPIGLSFPLDAQTEGTVATWAFMFAARYGFFPDSEVPFGRLQPYVAVGPAVMFSSQEPQVRLSPANGAFLNSFAFESSKSSVDIALAVDAGIRYMALKNVSIDLSFKYRWANPSYDFSRNFNILGAAVPVNVTYSPTYNLFSGQLGVAYHF